MELKASVTTLFDVPSDIDFYHLAGGLSSSNPICWACRQPPQQTGEHKYNKALTNNSLNASCEHY